MDTFCAIALTILALEVGRRTLGWTIVIISLGFMAYAFAGPLMPEMFLHKGITLKRYVDLMYMTDLGFWSGLTGLSAGLLYIFISFGVLLQATKTDRFYMDLSLAIAGKKPGGPAKVAILSSSAMGSISGSSLANVVTTGTLTIPLMKKTGYKPHEAGAIETVASAGGQIMPPIMGMGAFLMAEILGMQYFDIVKASFSPALLFYLTLWFFVDAKAKKHNLQGLNPDEIPNFLMTLKEGFHLFIPIIVLIWMLFKGFTPFMSGAICSVLILAIATIKRETRITLIELFKALEQCAVSMAGIAGVIVCAVIIVQMINYTGLMIKSTSIILHLSRGNLWATIAIEGLIAYILGMGLPVAESYIILATLGAPALIELGVTPLAAHLMIFWFAQLATITPPVCITAFAAAGIAKAPPMLTGFSSLKLGSTFYILPFLFVFTKILNVSSDPFQVILISFVAAIAMYLCVFRSNSARVSEQLGHPVGVIRPV